MRRGRRARVNASRPPSPRACTRSGTRHPCSAPRPPSRSSPGCRRRRGRRFRIRRRRPPRRSMPALPQLCPAGPPPTPPVAAHRGCGWTMRRASVLWLLRPPTRQCRPSNRPTRRCSRPSSRRGRPRSAWPRWSRTCRACAPKRRRSATWWRSCRPARPPTLVLHRPCCCRCCWRCWRWRRWPRGCGGGCARSSRNVAAAGRSAWRLPPQRAGRPRRWARAALVDRCRRRPARGLRGRRRRCPCAAAHVQRGTRNAERGV